MSKPHPGHLISWTERCRTNLQRLRRELPGMDREQQLAAIREQYQVLANIKTVCRGRAYFSGVPHRSKK